VGINIINATIMIIENAERFGLSQIHQLRGRVGRSAYPSKCLLLSSQKNSASAKKRLETIEKTTDGFRISEEDLIIRGPGEFLGERQSGFLQFRVAKIMVDAEILSEARKKAFQLVEHDSEIALMTFRLFRQMLTGNRSGITEFVSVT